MKTIHFMHVAIEEARKALLEDEVPVGAVIIYEQKILVSAHNLVERCHNSLFHAEMLCIQKACSLLKASLLEQCDLFVTLEPCPMCAGAIANSRIRRVFFGAYDVKGGGVEHGAKLFLHTVHKPKVFGGIMEQECSQLLRDFFKSKR